VSRLFSRALAAALPLVIVCSGAISARGPLTPGHGALLDELGRDRVVTHAETGTLRFVGGSSDRPAAGRDRLGATGGPREAARRFMLRYGTLFGVSAAGRDLRVTRTAKGFGGGTFVRFQQLHDGIPVIAGELTVQVADDGSAVSAIGEASPHLGLNTRPVISDRDAVQSAKLLVARAMHADPDDFRVKVPQLAIYDPRLVGAPDPIGVRLVWQTEVTSQRELTREYVLIDAITGAVVLNFEQLTRAKSRLVCDAVGADAAYPCLPASRAFEDPDPQPVPGISEAGDAYRYSGDWWDFFYKRFGRDSLDGAGMPLVSTVRYCESGDCADRNAVWDGRQAAFWPGMAADDIVAHELTHGFTELTSGLMYIYQSGAINEALSDIFGEFVDQTNGSGSDRAEDRWLIGEDSVVGAIRDMQEPPLFGDPDRTQSPMYDLDAAMVDHGGVHTNSGVANKAAFLMVDGEYFGDDGFNPPEWVTGIGIHKSAAIWYRVAAAYLSSGSDYADLGLALNQACGDLIGQGLNDGDGAALASGDLISGDDCVEVDKAVQWTGMALPPANGAAAPEAPQCTSGTPSDVLFDTIDGSGSGWTAGGTPNMWGIADVYATSNPWHLWGDSPPFVSDSWARRTNPITLPPNAFLHFRHYFAFEMGYDGGVVEYQVGSGAWQDADGLITHNGSGGHLNTGYGNPLGGRPAFTGRTYGYISSRVDLASLAGKSVRFRFRIGSDEIVAYDGWLIDDVRVYTCTGSADLNPPTVSAPNADLHTGVAVSGTNPVKLKVSFTASDGSGLQSTALQRRTNTGAWSSVALGSSTGTEVTVDYITSNKKKRQFRASAIDTNGNASAWATSPAFKVLGFQNGASGIVQTGSGWKTKSNSSHFGGSVRASGTAGARQSMTRTMSDVAIVTTLGPNRGKFDVYVDGQYKATIDAYSATTKYRQVVFAWDFGSSASHSIELRVLGAKNAASSGTRVDFDAFLVLAP
jgi:bacillolysin